MDKLRELYSKLPDLQLLKDEGITFSNGEGYILHNKEILNEVLNEWCEEAKKVYGDWDGLFDYRPVNTMGYIGRILSDASDKAPELAKMWQRLSNINNTSYKEWGQMYFSINEDKGGDICFNKYFRDQKLKQILD